MLRTALLAASVLFAASTSASAVPQLEERATTLTSVTTSGNAFFAGSNRFYVRGVDYQPGGPSKPVDPLANITTCTRDIAEFKKLGINTVRVYIVDNSANHDACMNALAAAGIYLAVDVNTALYSINRANPAASYNAAYLQSVFATVDAFAGYSNTLLFFSGNEVINSADTSNTAPYIKAVTRDIKSYIAARKYRSIPVGYSAADVSENRYQTALYMQCGPAGERSDFFAFNDYSWCPPSSYVQSEWAAKVALYSNYSLPLFLSEYGCITGTLPRPFDEVAALYSANMTGVYSGGLVYEYTEETDNPGYGLVQVTSSTAVTELGGFPNLEAMLAANPAPTGDGGYNASPAELACPPADANWVVADDTLPAFPAAASTYLKSGAGTGPGLTGAGSQNAGTAAPSVAAATTTATRTASGTGTATAAAATATVTKKAAASNVHTPSIFSSGTFAGLSLAMMAMIGMA